MRYTINNNEKYQREINFFGPHISHLKFINIFLINVEKLDIDVDMRTKVLVELSDLLVRDYVYDEGQQFENDSMSFGDFGKEIYEDLMSVWNYQICFCGQVGSSADELGKGIQILNNLEYKLGIN